MRHPPPTASELARTISKQSLSASENLDSALARIQDHASINAWTSLRPAAARIEARAVDAHIQQNGDTLAMAGIPVAVKDNILVHDAPCECGSAYLRGWRAPYDATVVSALRQHGALVLGKTNLDEFGMGASTERSFHGPTRNPWDPSRVAGGSSGGSAAAVATGTCLIALGSDTGGSLRQPAALCGVSALRPTYGTVSRFGLVAFASSLDQIGPMARHASDLGLALRAISGADPRDATSLQPRYRKPRWPAPADVSSAPLRGLRVGVADALFDGAEPTVVARVECALTALCELGATRSPVSLPHTHHGLACYHVISAAEASTNLARFDGIRYGQSADVDSVEELYRSSRSAGFGAEVKRRILVGTFVLSAGYRDRYYAQAQALRVQISRELQAAFDHCDILACPTSPELAFPIGARIDDPLAMYAADQTTVLSSLAGQPALSIPCGLGRARQDTELPVGLQLMAPHFADLELLAIAACLQQQTDWHRYQPPAVSESRP